ncbi:MAG: hypothetical protein DRH49_02290 [Candidatus Coatesbacteria bacterium]|nr:MAG: hypothetical protein DRH49_02290 [Candidatus Coatesbacteria bacterium]
MKYYFITYFVIEGDEIDGTFCKSDYTWGIYNSVTNTHPAKWLMKQNKENNLKCVIINFQEITKDEYNDFNKTFAFLSKDN